MSETKPVLNIIGESPLYGDEIVKQDHNANYNLLNDYAEDIDLSSIARDTSLQSQIDILETGDSNALIGVYTFEITGTDNYIGAYAGLTYFNGLKIYVKIPNSNTGASTININSIGIKNIKKVDVLGVKVDLVADDLMQNKYYLFIHDGTDFILDESYSGSQEPLYSTATINQDAISTTKTDSFKGISNLAKFGGATVYNKVLNGTFSGGTTNFTTTNTTGFTTVDGMAEFTATATSGRIAQTMSMTNGRTYSMIALVKADSSSVRANISGIGTVYHSGSGAFEKIAVNFVWTGATGNQSVEIRDDRTSGWTKVYVDYIILVDITDTIYSPYSSTQMKNVIGDGFEGLHSTQKCSVEGRGVNIFTENISDGLYILTADGKTTAPLSTRSCCLDYIPIEPSTTYYHQNDFVNPNGYNILYYDGSKNYISVFANSGRMFSFTTPSNAKYIRWQVLNLAGVDYNFSENSNVKIEVGSTPTPYQPYSGSTLTLTATDPTKFAWSRLPNGVENKSEVINGELITTQSIKGIYELKSTDIDALVTSPTNVDVVNIGKFTDYKYASTPTGSVGATIIGGFAEKSYADDVSNEWTYAYNFSSTNWSLVVPNGTYANLAAAQVALAGTKIIYELATPFTYSESELPSIGVTVEGSLKSSDDYTEFIAYDYDLLPSSIEIEYSRNISQSVDNNTDAIKGLESQVDGKANKTQEDYHIPTLLNGATHYPTRTLRYRKHDNGLVELTGTLGTIPVATGSDLFVLEEGYEPERNMLLALANTNGSNFTTASVAIYTTGVVEIYLTATYNNILDFGTVWFKAREV